MPAVILYLVPFVQGGQLWFENKIKGKQITNLRHWIESVRHGTFLPFDFKLFLFSLHILYILAELGFSLVFFVLEGLLVVC